MVLRAISPIDGRYADKVEVLREYASEWALMKYRVKVEIRWLVFMSEQESISHLRAFSREEQQFLHQIVAGFDEAAAAEIKSIERLINHDVKAVEYYIKTRLRESTLADIVESVHFACTSEDISNLAYAMMLRGAIQDVWLPQARGLLDSLEAWARESADVAMLARTHGAAASPTTVGKELNVFAFRLRRQIKHVETQDYLGKFNGAVGAFNAHVAAYPHVDWRALSRKFVEGLGLVYNPLTTQIEPHDYLAELCHVLMRVNTVALDFCRDMWAYISLTYFKQKVAAAEVGSSTMPHKVNPINFENAEANLGLSNAMLHHLASKLPVSRLQRDLSDTSALRNIGLAIAHSSLALQAAEQGLMKLELNRGALREDLDGAWDLLGEAIQTVMRKHHLPGAYEQLKAMTRGKTTSAAAIRDFIRSLDISNADKQRLLALSPSTYIGLARELALADGEMETKPRIRRR